MRSEKDQPEECSAQGDVTTFPEFIGVCEKLEREFDKIIERAARGGAVVKLFTQFQLVALQGLYLAFIGANDRWIAGLYNTSEDRPRFVCPESRYAL